MTRDGRGWHGDEKGHREAALKGQAEGANNTPMRKVSNGNLHEFIRNKFLSEWEEVEQDPQGAMESMGWEPFDIDKEMLNKNLNDTFSDVVDKTTESLIKEAQRTSKELTQDDIIELILWQLSGEIHNTNLKKYDSLSDHLESMLSDTTTNWIAEALNDAKEEDDDLPEAWMKKAKRELEKELGVKTKVRTYEYFGALALESTEGEANNGEREWIVFQNSEEAEKAAIAKVKQDLEYEPELFVQDWLQNYIKISDTDRRIIAGEEADDLVNEVYDEDQIIEEAGIESDIELADEKIAELERQYEHVDEERDEGVISEAEGMRQQEEINKDIKNLEKEKEKLIEDAKEKVRDDKYGEIYGALEDPVQYFVHDQGIYSMNDLMKASFITIDTEEAAEAAVRDDGVGHFLDVYDNSEVDLPSGAVAYGTN